FIAGSALGYFQSHLLKPFISIPYWRSNTAIAAVVAALIIGMLRVFTDSASTLSAAMDLSLITILPIIGLVQSLTLAKHYRYRILWMLPYLLMTIFAASQIWIPA